MKDNFSEINDFVFVEKHEAEKFLHKKEVQIGNFMMSDWGSDESNWLNF